MESGLNRDGTGEGPKVAAAAELPHAKKSNANRATWRDERLARPSHGIELLLSQFADRGYMTPATYRRLKVIRFLFPSVPADASAEFAICTTADHYAFRVKSTASRQALNFLFVSARKRPERMSRFIPANGEFCNIDCVGCGGQNSYKQICRYTSKLTIASALQVWCRNTAD